MTLIAEGELGCVFEVRLPTGVGAVHVDPRTAASLGRRLTVRLVVRALNELLERTDASQTFAALRRDGGVELAPDGLIDDG